MKYLIYLSMLPFKYIFKNIQVLNDEFVVRFKLGQKHIKIQQQVYDVREGACVCKLTCIFYSNCERLRSIRLEKVSNEDQISIRMYGDISEKIRKNHPGKIKCCNAEIFDCIYYRVLYSMER
jgi:hypothetical protein